MARFHVHSDCPDPGEIVRALKGILAEPDVRVLKSWRHLVANEPAANGGEPGPINVEVYWRRGQFALEVEVWGPTFGDGQTAAGFARALALAIGRPLLFSDCSAFALSYFLTDAKGAIWEVLLQTRDDDVLDLDDTSPYLRLMIAADEQLPRRAVGDPESWTHGDTTCEAYVPARPCRVFARECPKRRARWTE
jgi:hypothetical protein